MAGGGASRLSLHLRNKMRQMKGPDMKLKYEELTSANWEKFETLMGERGGCGNCWCMLFRLPYKNFQQNKPDGNKKLMETLVNEGNPAGLIAIAGNEPAGWIAMAPREDYIKIERAKNFKRIDDKPVWSITCFFVKKEFRKMGLSIQLIKAAIDFAKKKNIKVLEAYPAIPYSDKVPPPFLWVGVLSAFLQCGFKIVRQSGRSRAMVRLDMV
jgi:GNAT superfamily N-acetyltransferase